MAAIQIEVDTSALESVLEQLSGRAAAGALARAMNKTATSVRRRVLRELAAEIGLSQKRLRPQTRIRRVNPSALGRARRGDVILGGGARASAAVTAAGSDITLSAFRARQTRRGVSFRGGRVGGAFIATMPSGHEAVFIRAPDSRNLLTRNAQRRRRRRRKRRTGSDVPIAKLVRPGVSATLLDDSVQNALQQDASRTLARILQEEVTFELLKATGRITRRGRRRGR